MDSDIASTTSSSAMTKEEFYEACQLIIRLGRMAHRYGVSSPRIEAALSRLPEKWGLYGQVFVTPRSIDCVFWQPGDLEQYHCLQPLPEVSYDLTKLAFLGSLVHQFQHGKISAEEMKLELRKIEQLRPPYGNLPVGLGYALSGAGFAVLLSASWIDVVLSGILSLGVFALALLSQHFSWLERRFEITAALVVAVLANVIALHVFPGSNTSRVALCAVIVIIPGLALTQGVSEILSKSLLSGANRLIDGVLITAKLFLGATIGGSLVALLHRIPRAAHTVAFPVDVQWLAAIGLIFALALVFQVRPRDVGWATLAGALAYGGTKLGSPLGYWQGSFLGAVFLGLYANSFAWLRNLPQEIVILPGIMILVPGAAAYLGLATMETSGVISGLAAIGRVLVQIAAIFGGLVVASSIVPVMPSRKRNNNPEDQHA